MNLENFQNCPGTLAKGFASYSPTCLKNVFDGKKITPFLRYEMLQKNEADTSSFIENRKRISISGVQEKMSLLLEKKELRLTRETEQGTYILKPIPRDLKKVDQVPANEHLTMQIAKQVYKINTAENAMIFFKNKIPAYITKRFDVKPNGEKWGLEDFAILAGKTKDNSGSNFKYEYSYEELGLLFQKYVPAWRIEIEKYFSLVLFNYLFSNGDAHLKNFSLIETTQGDYIFSPAYDLINTRLHIDDSDFALSKGLFMDNYKSIAFQKTGHPNTIDFIEFGKRIGITKNRIDKIIAPFLERNPQVETLITNSFLNQTCKKTYLLLYNTKRNYLIAE
jgi:serine/threonine-protein kinase HipA